MALFQLSLSPFQDHSSMSNSAASETVANLNTQIEKIKEEIHQKKTCLALLQSQTKEFQKLIDQKQIEMEDALTRNATLQSKYCKLTKQKDEMLEKNHGMKRRLDQAVQRGSGCEPPAKKQRRSH